MTEMSAIEIIERTIAQLADKRDRAVKRSAEIATARAQLGCSVHADNDKVARGKLDKLNAEEASLAGETKGIGDALAEASKRLAAAHQAAEAEAAKANAVEVRKLLASFIEAAKDCDALLADFNASVTELNQALSAIHARGVAFPTHMQLQSLGKYCLLTALNKTPWAREFEIVAPGQRREFTPLVSQWVANIERNHIAPLLNPAQPKEEAAVDAKERVARAAAILAELEACGQPLDESYSHPQMRVCAATLLGSLLVELRGCGCDRGAEFPTNFGWHSAANTDLAKELAKTVQQFRGRGLDRAEGKSFVTLLQAFGSAVRSELARHDERTINEVAA
jgi:hypothetical protein